MAEVFVSYKHEDRVLVNEGYIDEPALLSILASQYGVPAAGS